MSRVTAKNEILHKGKQITFDQGFIYLFFVGEGQKIHCIKTMITFKHVSSIVGMKIHCEGKEFWEKHFKYSDQELTQSHQGYQS